MKKSECSYRILHHHLSVNVNKIEKHKSNLKVQVVTALVSHAAQYWSNKVVEFHLRPSCFDKATKIQLFVDSPNTRLTFV